MHTVATYLMKADLCESDVNAREIEILLKIDGWLKEKGAESASSNEGNFRSLTGGGEGRFTKRKILSNIGRINTINLIETAKTGQLFRTAVHIVVDHSSIIVYSILSAENEKNIISPFQIHPKCPKIIRNIINSYGDWRLEGNNMPSGKFNQYFGEDSGIDLCEFIRDADRVFPVIAISMDRDEYVWEDAPRQISRDMIGMAHVVTVDPEASWSMTDVLGKSDSCYLGAIRIYWPIANQHDDKIRGMCWTAMRLREYFGDSGGLKKFQSSIRGHVMTAAAASLSEPPNINNIYMLSARETIESVRKNAVDEQLNDIVEENCELTQKLESMSSELRELKWKYDVAQKQLCNMSGEGNQEEDGSGSNLDGADENNNEDIKKGEIRFYKKIGKKGGMDELVQTGSCNHNSWKPAFRAVQAEKGLFKLEGRNDWQSLQHCGACTGGGRWRVHW